MQWIYEPNGTEWDTPDEENHDRADWGEHSVDEFRLVCSGDYDLTAITDLIANLGHTFDRLKATHKMDDIDDDYTFEDAIESAMIHYRAERVGEF